ncbi:MAG: 5'-3' exonuclease H3TH domain-containing protein [Dehalococcoidia bacterium]|nr:5'-3' exonuclease H3TH domain-containing protein [Dehalococcoidia bacterium]
MRVHLVDGTYELFRHYFALPSSKAEDGTEVAALRGVLRSMLALLASGATHLGVATDHVIESFRNSLWLDYKTGAGVAPELLGQFPILEDALTALGVVVWPMVKYEADDALASAAAEAASYADQVLICTPDKDLAQCVVGSRVVQFDRRANKVLAEDAVVAKFGVRPASIPDYLALVGDSADGFPGLAGWGAKSAAAVLSRFHHLEEIPADATAWRLPVRGAEALAATLREQRPLALLFKDLATLRTSVRVRATPDRLRWTGPRRTFQRFAERLGAPELFDQATRAAAIR